MRGNLAIAGADLDLAQFFGVDTELDWHAGALCAQTDPEEFFPDLGGSSAAAKRVCAACPVRTDCLTYALDNNEPHGIWGGLSERERRRLKRGAA